MHFFQNLDPPPSIAYVRLYNPAQIIVEGCERHLDHAPALTIDFLKQINIPQNTVGFGDDRCPESIAQDNLQAVPGQPELFFAVHIWIGHGTRPDHAFLSFGFESRFQKCRRILLDFNILKRMGKLIAPAPAVAIDATVGTAPVYIHAIIPAFVGEYSLCVHKMHNNHSLPE